MVAVVSTAGVLALWLLPITLGCGALGIAHCLQVVALLCVRVLYVVQGSLAMTRSARQQTRTSTRASKCAACRLRARRNSYNYFREMFANFMSASTRVGQIWVAPLREL